MVAGFVARFLVKARSKTRRDWANTSALLFLAAATLVLSVVPLGCGDSTPGCVPGQSIACARNGCTDGHQVCEASGEAYGLCVCDDNSAEFPETGPNSGLIGAACTGPESCRLGLDCLTSESGLIQGEGPSAGICLSRCLPEHDFCQELDARSKCIVLDDGGTPAEALDDVAYCLPGCEIGTQPNELDKCRGRLDLVCSEAPAGSGVGYCRPACRGDLDCGARSCNLSTGLCRDRPVSGDPIGAECSADSTSSCAGGCIERGGGYWQCSGVCSYGTPGCGQAGLDGPLEYFCYLDPAVGTGAGDLGYCTKLCDCDDDCGRDDAVCEPDPSLAPDTGRAGACGSRTFPSGAVRPNIPC
jgi:hypothetical protein